jgi:hypothetical protein
MTGFAVKDMFFDRKKVMDAMDRQSHAALSKSGAFIKRRAQTSMRKRKRSARVGEPPSVHVGLLRKQLFNYWDARTKSMVIGPIKITAKGTDVPRKLETGGETTTVKKGQRVRVHVGKHPYMGPALQKELPIIPSRWSGSLEAR